MLTVNWGGQTKKENLCLALSKLSHCICQGNQAGAPLPPSGHRWNKAPSQGGAMLRQNVDMDACLDACISRILVSTYQLSLWVVQEDFLLCKKCGSLPIMKKNVGFYVAR